MRLPLWSRCRFIVLTGAIVLFALSFRQVSNTDFTARFRPGAATSRFGQGRPSLRRANHAPERNLVIDPVLVYSTLLGGTGTSPISTSNQQAAAMLIDGSGNVYLVGTTSASDFPVTPGVVQASNSGKNTVGFLAKMDPQGQLIFSTYLFGMSTAAAVAVDSSTGDIVVAGEYLSYFKSTPLPIPNGTTPFNAWPRPIAIVRLNGTATAVLNATYLGGTAVTSDTLNGLALDSSGNVYVDGSTSSTDFPVMNPIQPTLNGSQIGMFVTKLKPDLSALVYSTYLGQDAFIQLSASEGGTASGTNSRGIAVDASGDAYVTGIATPGFPTMSGALQPTCTTSCAFVAKLNPAGSALAYSTYVGGNPSIDAVPVHFNVNAIAVDASQDIFLGGAVWAPGFPTVNPVATCTTGSAGSIGNGFVAEISAAGALAFSTCLGQFPATNNNFGPDFFVGVRDVVLDASGKLYVTGIGSGQLPLQTPIQSTVPSDADPDRAAFVAAIDPATSPPTLAFSSLLAPSGTGLTIGRGDLGGSYPNAVGVDSAQNIYVAGRTYGNGVSGELPVFNAFQPAPKEPVSSPYSDAFLLKIAPTDASAATVSPGSLLFNAQALGMTSPPQTVIITNMGSAPLSISNATATGDFSAQNGCSSVAVAGGTCAIQVSFTPTATGNRAGTLTIIDNSAGSPHTISLSGAVGLVAARFSPSSLSFPATNLYANLQQTVTLTNTGELPLIITNVQVSGPFSQMGLCTYLVGGASCSNLGISFSPTTSGPATGALTITDNAVGSPHVLSLTGTGVASLGLGFAPSNFGVSVSAGSTGGTVLTVGGAGIAGSVNLSCSGVPAGATCSLSPSTLQVSATSASRTELTVTTTARSHLLLLSPIPLRWLCALTVLALTLVLRAATASPSLRARWRLIPLFAMALCACGGGGSSGGGGASGTPAGNYTIVVTGTSGSTTQSFNVSLTVQ
jgi:hypothetical protein